MFIVTLITAIFGLFNYYNKKRYEAYKKKTDQDNQLKKYVTLNYQSERRMKDVTTIAKDNGHRMFTVESRRGGKVQKITSPYTATGYLFMLLLRFTMEFFFVVFEVTLAIRVFQKVGESKNRKSDVVTVCILPQKSHRSTKKWHFWAKSGCLPYKYSLGS